MLTKKQAIKVLNRGSIYYPAWMHYGNQEANVCCDYCERPRLKISIGVGHNTDICLTCAERLASKPQNTLSGSLPQAQKLPVSTLMLQASTRPRVSTYMMQDSTRPRGMEYATNMMQDSTRPR